MFLMSSTEFLRSDFDLLLVFEFWWARALWVSAVRRPGQCLACVLEREKGCSDVLVVDCN